MAVTDFEGVRNGGYIIVVLVQMVILFYLSGFLMKRTASCTMGWSRYLFYAFVFAGTVIHEASHAIAVILSGGKLNEVKLFKPDRKSGNLGYVRYNANHVSSVFIGFAPFVGNTLALMLFARYLAGIEAMDFGLPGSGSLVSDIARIFSNGIFMLAGLDYSRMETWLFLYLALSTGIGVAPSTKDIRIALPGIAILGIFWGIVMYMDSSGIVIDRIMPALIVFFSVASNLFTFGITFTAILSLVMVIICRFVGKSI